jgi:O-antigen/teichoic acid export membrane protein
MAATFPEVHHLRRERERRAWLTSKVNIISRSVTYGARLLVIPLSLKLLGNEQYGLWLAIGSLISWLNMSDFGFSQALINGIGEASGLEDRVAIRCLISTGFALFSLLSLILSFFVIWASSWTPLDRLLGVQGNPLLTRDTHLLILICGLFFAASLSFRGVDAVCQGLQEGYLSAWFGIGATVLNLASVGLLYWYGSSLGMYALAMTAPPLLATLALACYLFAAHQRDLCPSPNYWNASALRTIFRFGGPLFLLQLATVAMFYSINLLIANRLGPAEVPKFAVPYSLFMIVVNVCHVYAQPYIPAYAEAYSRGDFAWIRRRAVRSLVVTISLVAVLGVVLTGMGSWLVRLWVGPEVAPGTGFLFVMSFFAILMVSANTNGFLLVGLGRIWTKTLLQTFAAGVFILGAWLMLPRIGLIAVPLSGVVALAADPVLSLSCSFSHLKRVSRKRVLEFQVDAVDSR